MRGIRRAGVAAVLFAGISLAGPSPAEPPFKGPHESRRPPDRIIEQHAERLGLDQETRDAIHRIVEESRARGEEYRLELRDAHAQMRQLLEQDTPDEDDVMRQVEVIGELEIEERKHRFASMLAIRAKLTPEQRAEMAKIREEKRTGRKATWRKRLEGACGGDLEQFCAGLEPGPELGACLRKHRDQLSEQCRGAMRQRRGDPRRRL